MEWWEGKMKRCVWYLLYVILAISAISEPVGPHGSLLVAVRTKRQHCESSIVSLIFLGHFYIPGWRRVCIPFRTFTCTDEYPFVTFLMLRSADDILKAAVEAQ